MENASARFLYADLVRVIDSLLGFHTLFILIGLMNFRGFGRLCLEHISGGSLNVKCVYPLV